MIDPAGTALIAVDVQADFLPGGDHLVRHSTPISTRSRM
jgi:nicotinamidase-related amidase